MCQNDDSIYHIKIWCLPIYIIIILVKNHGLNKSRVPSHNGGTIYHVTIYRRAVATSNAKTAFMRGMKCNAALFFFSVKNNGQ